MSWIKLTNHIALLVNHGSNFSEYLIYCYHVRLKETIYFNHDFKHTFSKPQPLGLTFLSD